MMPNSYFLGDILKVVFKVEPSEQWQTKETLLSKNQWKNLLEGHGFIVQKIYSYNKYPELFKNGSLKLKSIRKFIKTFLMKYFCPFNLSWQFIFLCINKE
ncbi:MAG: hypothetical protein NC936_00345 [Candidatus Omnitrophica bacterium]|nr:hypothetical protein [Candidatus Omnitrophota bacterium]